MEVGRRAVTRSWIREMWAYLGNNENSAVDPLWDVDRHFRDLALVGTTHELVAELDAALETERDGEVPWAELSLDEGDSPVDDGPGGTAALLRGLRHRALAVQQRPERVPDVKVPSFDGVCPPRTSGFLDGVATAPVLQRVWEGHADEIAAMASGRSGWGALSFYEVMPDPIGWVEQTAPGARSDRQLVSAVVAVVALDEAAAPYVSHLRPEITLDTAIRAAFPALCHFWGGWFHPHDGYPIGDVVDAMRATRPPALGLVRDELDRLLDEDPDDDRCRAVAQACGSSVLPQQARHWVDLMRWRFNGYDWAGPR